MNRVLDRRDQQKFTELSYVGTMYLILMYASSPPLCSNRVSVSLISSPRQSYCCWP